MRAREFVTDAVNQQVFSPGWTDETTILGRYILQAQALDDWNRNQKLKIKVYDPEKKSSYHIAEATFRIRPGFFFQKNLVASMIYVAEDYQRQGIATAIYQYVRKLGNTIKPSSVQLKPGKAMWKSFNRTKALAEETVPAQQVLQYVKQAHAPDKFDIEYSITDHPKWQLTNIPLSQLKLDPDGEQQDPYSRVNWVDYDKVAELVPRIGSVLRSMPIVVDAEGWIIDGNHRATAAAEAGLTSVPAYVPAQKLTESFNQCFTRACQLYDRAESKGIDATLLQVADYQGDGSDADARWQKLPQYVWKHYVTVIGDTVYDPTAEQFGPNKPKQYSLDELKSQWKEIYQIRSTAVNENFADGKVKGKSRPGRVRRAGASCNGSVTDLRARAKKYGGERGRMYHWCANMKSGKKNK